MSRKASLYITIKTAKEFIDDILEKYDYNTLLVDDPNLEWSSECERCGGPLKEKKSDVGTLKNVLKRIIKE